MDKYYTMTMADGLAALKSRAGAVLLDVRRPDEFAEGRIPGARNIPLDTIGPDTKKLLPDPAAPLFVHCRSGVRSRAACEKLLELGYTDVVNIGGILDYDGPQEK